MTSASVFPSCSTSTALSPEQQQQQQQHATATTSDSSNLPPTARATISAGEPPAAARATETITNETNTDTDKEMMTEEEKPIPSATTAAAGLTASMSPPAMKAPFNGGQQPAQQQQQQQMQQQQLQPAPHPIQSMSLDGKVKEFAKCLGANMDMTRSHHPIDEVGVNAMLSCYPDSIGQEEVVLIIPALDIKLSGDGTTPGIGESSHVATAPGTDNNSNNATNNTANAVARPNMAASVLTAASNEAAEMEQQAAKNVSKQTSWTKASLPRASQAVATNAAEFFSKLIDSRLRSWTLLLLRHSLSTGEHESRSRLLRMLSSSIKVLKSETNFKTLQLPPSAAGQPKEADVILPLLFEVSLHLNVRDKTEKVTLRAPGTVSAHVNQQNAGKFSTVAVNLDTNVMLNSMVDQARLLVFKAVATATKTPLPSMNGMDPSAASAAGAPGANGAAAMPRPTPPSAASSQASGLSTFQSALNLGPSSNFGQKKTEFAAGTAPGAGAGGPVKAPGLLKSRASALRLTGVLYGKAADAANAKSGMARCQSTIGMRRIRSVRWDTPGQIPKLGPVEAEESTSASSAGGGVAAPSPKKAKLMETACKLKSFKSFGRPHAGDFGTGPRNATFAAFGGCEVGARGQTWGRDGRLAAHPSPMQVGGTVHSDEIGLSGLAGQNASFGTPAPQASSGLQPPVKKAPIDLNKLLAARKASMGKPSPMLPRTTTGLELWLKNQSTGRR